MILDQQVLTDYDTFKTSGRAIVPRGRSRKGNTMHANNTISVIITNYNYERYVGGAIDSVIAQTRSADEIIVIDDGSTDRSRERIASYGDKI